MGRPTPTHLVVGHVANAHGTDGEVVVRPLTDHPEESFSPGVVLLSGGETEDAPDYDRPPLRVETSRPHKGGFLIHFGGVRDRNEADALRGLYLYRGIEELAPLDDDEVFHHQLVGLEVRMEGRGVIGTVDEVYEAMPFDLLEIRTDTGMVLVPYSREVVPEVDVEGGWLRIDPPEGLLELED